MLRIGFHNGDTHIRNPDTLFPQLYRLQSSGDGPIQQGCDPAYLQDVPDIKEAYSPDDPILLFGHSWGGAYAAYFTQQYPDLVRALVLIEPVKLTKAAFESGGAEGNDLFSRGLNRILVAMDRIRPDNHQEADYYYQFVVSELEADGIVVPKEVYSQRNGYTSWIETVKRLGFTTGNPMRNLIFSGASRMPT